MEGSFFWLAPGTAKAPSRRIRFLWETLEMDTFFAAAGQLFVNIRNQIQMITISDIIDIAIIAYIAYRMLLLVRHSRGAQVAKAIVLLLAALVLSNAFRLNVVNFILSKTVELGLLTVAAYTALSRDKVGALMVFERKTPLDDIIKTGTVLDCSVSSELLKNLFWNKAPLHDGAVIVRNGRIVGAGCVLPLSGNTNLSKDLGMRHRAGIGMSENSDAVVAIVSEETGSISVAVNGMLKRHLAPETLERLMENELMPEQEPAKPSVLANLFKSKKGESDDGETNH